MPQRTSAHQLKVLAAGLTAGLALGAGLPGLLPHGSASGGYLLAGALLALIGGLMLLRWGLRPHPEKEDHAAPLSDHFALLAEPPGGNASAEELIRSRDAAVASTRSKSEFLARMSHEIRTPMNGVIGMAGLLLETELTPDQREYAEAIRGSSDELLGVLNDILDVSRIEAGKLTIEPISFDLQHAIQEIVDCLAPRAGERGLDLVVRIAPETPRHVIGDAGRLRQILTNLVSNALKFTTRGHVLIDVEPVSGPGDTNRLRFAVEDSGIGISEDRLAGVFDSFTQAEPSTGRRFGGTGLGLTISRQLAELMGGQVGVESVVGHGSTFWLVLPLPEDSDASPIQPPGIGAMADVRALVVEEDEINRRVLCEQLESWGLRPSAVERGDEALMELRSALQNGDRYRAVVLNHQLPDMEGESLGRAIKGDAELEQVVLVMLTSIGRPGDGRRLASAGFSAYMVKPIHQDDLRDALALACNAADRGIEIPLITRHSLAEGRAVQSPITPPTVRSVQPSILVAEDNVVNQKVAIKLLERLGCRVDVVGNGDEAATMLAARSYDLVFMDCQMPVLDGYHAAVRIRRSGTRNRSVPIVAMTASAMRGDRERCLAAGMDDYISKPIHLRELGAALDRWLPAEAPGAAADPAPTPPVVPAGKAGHTGSGELAAEVTQTFLRDMPPLLGELEAAVAARDATSAYRLAHRVKGSCLVVGAWGLSELLAALEVQCSTAVPQRALKQVARIVEEYGRVRQQLMEVAGGSPAAASAKGVR